MMKVGNIVPRAGLEPTYLTFWASVIPLHYGSSLMLSLYPQVSADYYTRPHRIVNLLMLIITYIQAIAIHRVGSTTIQCIAGTGSWSQ